MAKTESRPEHTPGRFWLQPEQRKSFDDRFARDDEEDKQHYTRVERALESALHDLGVYETENAQLREALEGPEGLQQAWADLVQEDCTAFKSASGGPANRYETLTPGNLRHVVRSRKMEASWLLHRAEKAEAALRAAKGGE